MLFKLTVYVEGDHEDDVATAVAQVPGYIETTEIEECDDAPVDDDDSDLDAALQYLDAIR